MDEPGIQDDAQGCLPGLLIALLIGAYLARNEQLFTWAVGVIECLGDVCLVLVDGGSVDVGVPHG